MKYIAYPKREDWKQLQQRPTFDTIKLFSTVQEVINRIENKGDEGVKYYEQLFDKVDLTNLRVNEQEIIEAEKMLPDDLKDAILLAHKNISLFHKAQQFQPIIVETQKGVTCQQRSIAIEKVGLYIPGGTAPLFSSVLMLAAPAKIAGCKDIILCSPPNKEGKIHPAILFAAKTSGVNHIFKIGGAQAIAAMALGTETVPKVDKIFGPGNQYVMAAKQIVSLGDVAIDMPAGPSEVEVIADAMSNPVFVAADLLSQAEHGVDSQVLLISTDASILEKVEKEINKQLDLLPRKETAARALENSKMILLKNEEDIIDFTNEYAPEHLVINTQNYLDIANNITHAGSVFLGPYSCESAGDYASGTNHTLPTKGYAKAYSGLCLDSFVRKITFQELTPEGIQNIGKAVELMAEAEQLEAHKNAMTVRINSIKNKK